MTDEQPNYGPSPIAACYPVWLEMQRTLDEQFRHSMMIPADVIESSTGCGYSGAKVAQEIFYQRIGLPPSA